MLIMKKMPRKFLRMLLAALVCLFPMTVHAQIQGQPPVDAPKIVFEASKHDFGAVQPNTPLTHNFVFTNQGTAPLLIEKVKAG